MIEHLAASRCPECRLVAAPPSRWCPRHPVEMTPTSVMGGGEVVSFTTLHSPPEGFRSPLHIALVDLVGGARLVCHGDKTQGLKIGSWVAIEAVGNSQNRRRPNGRPTRHRRQVQLAPNAARLAPATSQLCPDQLQ